MRAWEVQSGVGVYILNWDGTLCGLIASLQSMIYRHILHLYSVFEIPFFEEFTLFYIRLSVTFRNQHFVENRYKVSRPTREAAKFCLKIAFYTLSTEIVRFLSKFSVPENVDFVV